MKRLSKAYILLFLFFGMKLFSQPFNNEWISYSQIYFKIKIAKDGLYKIDSTTLANAGLPLSSINPKNFQLFHKGKEIYPYIFGENDGALNTNDYILFYAEKNTAKDDSLLFDKVPYISNPYFSIINDTSAVFLTWNTSANNKRLSLNTDTTYSQSAASPYYLKEVITGNSGGYSTGPLNFLNLSDPRYKLGEGFIHAQITEGNAANLNLNTSAVYAGGPQALITVCMSGANDIAFVTYDHQLEVTYTDNTSSTVVLIRDSINSYDSKRLTFTVSPTQFGASTALACSSLVNPKTTISNYYNVNYLKAF